MNQLPSSPALPVKHQQLQHTVQDLKELHACMLIPYLLKQLANEQDKAAVLLHSLKSADAFTFEDTGWILAPEHKRQCAFHLCYKALLTWMNVTLVAE
jgi:hypothetical protein